MRRVSRFALALAVLVLVLAAARLALDPIAAWRTRKVLAGIEGKRGTFSSVEVGIRDLSYVVRDLRIDDERPGGPARPLFQARSARFRLGWRELLHGRVAGALDLDAPRLTVAPRPPPQKQKESGDRIREVPRAARRLPELGPFLVDRAQVRDGTLVLLDPRAGGQPVLTIHGIEGTLENLATRPGLSEARPTVLAAKGTLQRTGRISVFATADPLARRVTFAGEGTLSGLALVELQGLFASRTRIEPDAGILDMTITFKAVEGRIAAGVRPLLKGASTEPSRSGLLPRLESIVSDSALELYEEKRGPRDPAETTVPLSGTVSDPEARPIPVVLGVLRNAFVRGLSDAFSGRPPPGANEPGGAREQARRGKAARRGEPEPGAR